MSEILKKPGIPDLPKAPPKFAFLAARYLAVAIGSRGSRCHGYCASPARPIWFYLHGAAQGVLMRIHALALAEAVVRASAAIKSNQGAPIFTHPLHHPANATLFPAKSAQEPIDSPVFL